MVQVDRLTATILTIYALKKFQEQLLQSSCYKCEEIPPDSEFFIQSNIFNSINQSLQIFLITRFGSSSNGRVVEYSLNNEIFTCTCGYMAFSGIICHHILRVATQLNIDSFSKKMYPSCWCKDPNESEMIQIYQSFYKHKPLHDLQDQLIMKQPQLEQDYKYKLNRTIWKLQRFPKGGVHSNKRKKSGIEINSQRKKSKKLKEKDSNGNKENIMIGNKGNSSSNDENINSITIPEICPYCDEKLPSPLPNKLKDLFMNFQGKRLKAVEQFEFCHAHIGEMQIIPDGIKKGYPTVIDFNSIPKRIENFSTDLLDICKKKVKSFYRDNFMREYCDKGKNKINSPMSLMSRIESFQPGYYGPRDAIVIAETLRKLFIDTKILTKSLTIPQTPMEYLQEVLIPEAAVRFIQEDKDITAEKVVKLC
ncbi:hypothetical protein RIR_jg3899.t1 [Rhizophagus irregularis DAOM 181602=DAOM 197198]|nr:hypothetical protein RIR_jg3899.t1 [Rhizophagus irregularis DAOM 181602=DAOM 197198]